MYRIAGFRYIDCALRFDPIASVTTCALFKVPHSQADEVPLGKGLGGLKLKQLRTVWQGVVFANTLTRYHYKARCLLVGKSVTTSQ